MKEYFKYWWHEFKLGNVAGNRRRAEYSETCMKHLEEQVESLQGEADLMQAALDNFQGALTETFTEKQIDKFLDASDKLFNKDTENETDPT